MAEVMVQLPDRAYAVRIAPGLLVDAGTQVRAVAPHNRAAVINDVAVSDSHASRVGASMEAAAYRVTRATVASGEEQKNLDTIRRLYEVLCTDALERRSPVVAVGGGVTGDAVGFVAATYLRGVPFVQCPTTLLSMVDASVGGKVGVNIPQGKNLVGAFHQPAVVLIDTDTLGTLPAREIRCGLAECVKHAMIRDPDLLDWIEAHVEAILARDDAAMVELVRRNVAIKAAVVAEDEREAGVRAHLNFGHTFAHAVEAVQHYSSADGFRHGEAVAIGMVAATHLAADLGWVDAAVPRRLSDLLSRIGLPVTGGDRLGDRDALMEAMWLDKKVRDARITLVLPRAVGEVVITSDISADRIRGAWDAVTGPVAP